MTITAESPLARQVAGAIDWWREAGVDLIFADDPSNWIAAAPSQPEAPALAMPPPAKPASEPWGRASASWPATLEAFAPWWLSEPALDGGQIVGRAAPRGVAGSELLVLVEQPEAGDGPELLSGADGALVAAMLAAMGIASEQAYFASVLPRHMPHPDWTALAAQGLGELLLHHLTLAAPRRVIAFGGNILPLLGHDPANSSEFLLQLNPEGEQVPVLAARELSILRGKPAWKAALWRRWLDWTG